MYYFIDEKTKEFVIAIVYVNEIFSALLRVEVEIHNEIRML